MVRRQADEESRLIETVSRVLDLIDERKQVVPVADAGEDLTRGDGQAIALPFDLLGASRDRLALGDVRQTTRLEDRLDHPWEHAGEAEMAENGREQFALRRVETLRQISLDLVADEAGGAPVLEAFAGDMQDAAKKRGAFALAQRLSERHAIGDATSGRPPHRVEDEIGAPELEEGAMAVLALRGADEQFDRPVFGHE